MEDVQLLRRRIASGELSVREAARLLGHSRNTVRRYLAGAGPGSYSTVKEIVREIRRRDREVCVPLIYEPGEVAQCDFFDVWTEQAGVVRRGRMFQMRLMYSGVNFSWIFEHEDLPSFLEGHRRAFEFFGGVMHRCAYDNLRRKWPLDRLPTKRGQVQIACQKPQRPSTH